MTEPDPNYNSMEERYRKEHHRFLRESNPKFLAALTKSGRLEEHLKGTAEDAAEMHDQIVRNAMRQDEQEKLSPQERLARLPSHQSMAEECVRHDLIHQPLPEQTKRG